VDSEGKYQLLDQHLSYWLRIGCRDPADHLLSDMHPERSGGAVARLGGQPTQEVSIQIRF
jgi:hypothetical protein